MWAAVLHCLETHFTKTLSDTDKNNLNSEHKDQNLQGGVIVSSDGDICIISFVNVLDASGIATVSHLFYSKIQINCWDFAFGIIVPIHETRSDQIVTVFSSELRIFVWRDQLTALIYLLKQSLTHTYIHIYIYIYIYMLNLL